VERGDASWMTAESLSVTQSLDDSGVVIGERIFRR
jgi:hypothetical protein